MYEFYIGENKHSIKNSWDELSEEEFIKVSDLIREFRKGNIDLLATRARMVLMLLKITPTRRAIRPDKPLNENVYRLGLELGFFFLINYADKKTFRKLPFKLQRELLHKFPEDLEPDENVDIARQFERKIKLDIVCGKMFLSSIITGRQCFHRYNFNVIGKNIETSLFTAQYIDAQLLTVQYINQELTKTLSLLCGTLYQIGYSRTFANEMAIQFEKVPFSTKEAIMLNFIAINNYIGRYTKYSILFDDSCDFKIKNKMSPGLGDYFALFNQDIYKNEIKDESIGLIKFLDGKLKELMK